MIRTTNNILKTRNLLSGIHTFGIDLFLILINTSVIYLYKYNFIIDYIVIILITFMCAVLLYDWNKRLNNADVYVVTE